jgi:outer membrane protein assembly factor BamB/predicted Ser/Thr protein kinase
MNSERYQQVLSQIGRYELIDEIGRGGMGVVYRAYDAALDRTVALKLLAPELASQPGFVARLRREAISAARLRHPHITLLYEFGQAESTAFLAMEYMPGCSLRQLLEAGPLPLERALAILEQIGQALDYAHRMGIVHRDVKPSNILVGQDDHAMLIDFGLAEVSESTLLTSDGAVLGTPHYMAPEQAAGRGADARSDQYGLAVVAYELLTGAPPFHGRSATAVVHAHIYELPPPPTEQCPSLPVAINQVLLRGLAKQPQDRYASLGAFVAALRGAIPRPEPTPAARSRARLWWGGAGAVALVMALLLGVLLWPGVGRSGDMRLSAQAVPRAGVPLPRQVIWAFVSDPNFVGGSAPVASDDTLIVGTLDGQVLGIQASSGELRWRTGGGATTRLGAPSTGKGLVFVGSADSFVQGLSLSSGKTTWQTKIVGVAHAAPTLDGDRLIVTTDKGYVYLLQAGSGQVIWDRPLAQNMQAPSVSAGRIFLSAGSTLYALDVNNGVVDWTFEAPGLITTRPVIAGDMVVVGTERGLLYALRMSDGQLHLRYQASGALLVAPAAEDKLIFIADQSGSVAAVSLTNASLLWRFRAGSAILATPLLVGDRLFVGASDGMLYTIDARDGRQITQIKLGGSVVSEPALGGGLIFVRADRIYALGEK